MWNSSDMTIQHDGMFNTSAVNNSITELKPNSKKGENCFPVMIAHLNRYGDNLEIWGVPAKLITFVAVVCNVEVISTKVNFIFRDETGTTRGVKWLDSDTTLYNSPVNINSYGRVYGMIRKHNNEAYVLVVNIRPMEHLNELLTHLMEVTVMCMENEKMVNTVAQNDCNLLNSSASASMFNTNEIENYGLNHEQALILNIIRHSDTEYGAERSDIKSRVPPNVASKVDEILEFLSSEGHIYTTKTDDFFKII